MIGTGALDGRMAGGSLQSALLLLALLAGGCVTTPVEREAGFKEVYTHRHAADAMLVKGEAFRGRSFTGESCI